MNIHSLEPEGGVWYWCSDSGAGREEYNEHLFGELDLDRRMLLDF